MKRFVFKISLYFLIFILISTCFIFSSTYQAQASVQAEFCGYYEERLNSGTLTFSQEIIGNVTSVDIEDDSAVLNSSNLEISGKEITLKNLPVLELGKNYTLNITASTTYAIQFKYITKAIRVLDDSKIFDVKENTTKIYGYYVLLNNLDFGDKTPNEHAGIGNTPYLDNGFYGTFDGLGHYITFKTNRNGFFGRLCGGAKILNLGFVNTTYNIHNGTGNVQGGFPTLAFSYYTTNAFANGLVKNCYFHSEENGVQGGAITAKAVNTDRLKIENIIIKFGNMQEYVNVEHWGRGIFISDYDISWWSANRDDFIKDVYAISGFPLCHRGVGEKPTNNPNADWIDVYASNRGITEDRTQFIKVLDNVKQYLSVNEMKEDSNDYSSFDTRYWDVSSGIPVWKSEPLDFTIKFETDVEFSEDNIPLVFEEAKTVKFKLGTEYEDVEDVELNYEMLSSYGKYTYQTDVVSVSGVGTNILTVTPVKVGVGRIRVYCVYQNRTFEKTIKFSITTNAVDQQKPNDGSTNLSGWAGLSNNLKIIIIAVPSVVVLLGVSITVVVIVKKRNKN